MTEIKSSKATVDELAVTFQNANDSGYFSPSFGSRLTGSDSGNDENRAIERSRSRTRKKWTSPHCETNPSREFVRKVEVKTIPETVQTDRIYASIQKAKGIIVNDRIVTTHLIGRYVSKEHIDFIRELVTLHLDHVLSKIFIELTSSELNCVCRVSTTWRESCRRDADANTRWREFRRYVASEKENSLSGPQKATNETRKVPCLLKEAAQNVVNASNNDELVMEREVSVFSRFTDEARKLKADEKLDKCPRCLSPARVTKKLRRAVCSLYGCSFEYCIACRCAYSPEHKCDPLSPKFTGQAAMVSRGNVKVAKKSLRRLLN